MYSGASHADFGIQRAERLEKLTQLLKETRFDNETRLVTSFNNYLDVRSEKINRRKNDETWSRWLDQSGRPDMLSVTGFTITVSNKQLI